MTTPALVRSPVWSADPSTLDEQLLSREWLVTNGLGGYASGTVGGVLTRRHHGLLIAGLPAPLGRTLMFSQLRETLIDEDGQRVPLWGEHHNGQQPEFHCREYFKTFRLEFGLPIWEYRLGECVIEKRIVMPHRCNTVCIAYRMLGQHRPLQLDLRPMIQVRGHDEAVSSEVVNGRLIQRADDQIEIDADTAPQPLKLQLSSDQLNIVEESLVAIDCYYQIEADRGYDHVGDLWSPGNISTLLTPTRPVTVIASLESWEQLEIQTAEQIFGEERARRQTLLQTAAVPGENRLAQELVLAADQFLIQPPHRSADDRDAETGETTETPPRHRRSVIAGYPWFTDWGRDTMISLRGLTLATRRFDDARRILETFANYVKDGLIPNLFPEGGQEGMYHTADATLWFFQAVHWYLEATDDWALVESLLPVFEEIVQAHLHGTHFGIHVDHSDALLVQGQHDVQLTWMDAKVDDWVVTPRRGKAVEINALWYNAMRLYETWQTRADNITAASDIASWHERAKESFNRRFWYAQGQYLYDVIDGEQGDDTSLRPNQLFAISLTHPVLNPIRWPPIVAIVRKQLLTPVGLRSLSPDHSDYHGRYVGDLWQRDAAYHQGTVWSWLIGPFLDASIKADADERDVAERFLQGLDDHLSEACVGQVSEIFDGDPPHTPRGCIAQAWGVAEWLNCVDHLPETQHAKSGRHPQ